MGFSFNSFVWQFSFEFFFSRSPQKVLKKALELCAIVGMYMDEFFFLRHSELNEPSFDMETVFYCIVAALEQG